ncbi:MAG: BamA/TamA family outer membrane protein [bacterium]
MIATYFILAAGSALGQVELISPYNHPELEWRTIETPHFLIIYHRGDHMGEIAEDAARIAESAYERIAKLYDYKLEGRLPIVLQGYEDITNGFTDPLTPRIVVWTSHINDFRGFRGPHDEWMENVISHELAHIVHMRSVYGGSALLRNIFGGIILPNALSPMYYIEALGQYGSQEMGSDAWDSHRDMILRQRALNNDFYKYREMAAINEQKSPYGESHYNSGLSFINYLTDKFGPEVIPRINRIHSDNFLWGFDSSLEKATGEPFDKLYWDWRVKTVERYRQQKNEISREGAFSEVQHLNVDMESVRAMRYSDDGKKMAFIGREKIYRPLSLFVMNRSTLKIERVESEVSPEGLSWRGDEIAYVKSERDASGSYVSDLYLYDILTGKRKRLTYGARAFFPDISPDGRRLAFVKNTNGNLNIFIMDLENGELQKVTNTDYRTVYADPTWSPDGKRLLFSSFDGKRVGIYTINPDGTGLTPLVVDEHENNSPIWGEDGESILFSSDRNGVFNIYELRPKDGTLLRLTNTLGGLFCQDFDGKKVLASSYTFEGYRIGEVDYRPIEVGPYKASPKQINERTANPSDRGAHPAYNPLDTFHPLFWYPALDIRGEDLLLGAGTVASDALQKHLFLATGLYSLGAPSIGDRPNGYITYINRTLYPTLTLSGFYSTLNRAIEDKTFWWRRYGGTLTATFPILTYYSLGGGYSLRRGEAITDPRTVKDKGLRPTLGNTSSVLAFGQYRKVHSSLDWSEGVESFLSYERTDKFIASDFTFDKVESGASNYLPLPTQNSTLKMALRAGFSLGDETEERRFALGGPDIMRGYFGIGARPLEGDKYAALAVDYLFPLIPDLGWKFWTLYFDRLGGTLFAEVGGATNKDLRDIGTGDLKEDVGAELRLPISTFYLANLNAKAGVAYAIPERRTTFYLGVSVGLW